MFLAEVFFSRVFKMQLKDTINNLRDGVRVHEIWCFFHRPAAFCTAVIHPKTVFETLKNATKPESKEVSFLEKHSHHPRHQKCAGIFQHENLSLGLTNSSAKVFKKKIMHGEAGRARVKQKSSFLQNEGLRAQRRPKASEDITSCCH